MGPFCFCLFFHREQSVQAELSSPLVGILTLACLSSAYTQLRVENRTKNPDPFAFAHSSWEGRGGGVIKGVRPIHLFYHFKPGRVKGYLLKTSCVCISETLFSLSDKHFKVFMEFSYAEHTLPNAYMKSRKFIQINHLTRNINTVQGSYANWNMHNIGPLFTEYFAQYIPSFIGNKLEYPMSVWLCLCIVNCTNTVFRYVMLL